MKFEMENSTLPSVSNAADNKPRWASFEFYPETEGETMYIFRGVTYENLCYSSREDSVIKSLKSKTAVLEDWLPYSQRAVKAKELAKSFNQMLLKHSSRTRVGFVTPHIAVMDKVFTFTPVVKFFKPFNKSFDKNEHVAFETYIDGNFQSFVSKNGATATNMPFVDILQSFAHYTYYKTGGDLVITDLKGALDSNKFILTVPNVHSRKREYNTGDNGIAGISEFFSNHSCTELCKYFPKLDDTSLLRRPSASAPTIDYSVQQLNSHKQVPFTEHAWGVCSSDVPIPMPPPYVEKCNTYETVVEEPTRFDGYMPLWKCTDKEDLPGIHYSSHGMTQNNFQ